MKKKVLAARLQELVDREAIRSLPLCYCHCVWQRDLDGYVALFTEDGSFGSDDPSLPSGRGREELRRMIAGAIEQTNPRPFIHNHVIELHGPDRATGTCYLEVTGLQDGEAFAMRGWYDDEYVKVGDEWKFRSRRITTDPSAPSAPTARALREPEAGVAAATDVALHYFHGRGIGEPIRLLLTVGGIAFDDRRYSVDEFAGMTALKARLPFGQLPALEVDGVFLGQTDSIARYAARLAGLYPADALAAAQSDMIVVHQAEIQAAIAKMSFDGVPGAPGTRLLPEPERRRRIDAWLEDTLPGLLRRLEQLADGVFMVGSQRSWADICVFNRLNQLLDMRDDVLRSDFPALRAVYERVEALPQVQAWMQAHKDDYPRFTGVSSAPLRTSG